MRRLWPIQTGKEFWQARTMTRQQKITLGEMRESGPIRLIVYCGDYKCAHSVVIDADRWPNQVRLSDLEPRHLSGLRASRHRCPTAV
jgi:hypothetical protein